MLVKRSRIDLQAYLGRTTLAILWKKRFIVGECDKQVVGLSNRFPRLCQQLQRDTSRSLLLQQFLRVDPAGVAGGADTFSQQPAVAGPVRRFRHAATNGAAAFLR